MKSPTATQASAIEQLKRNDAWGEFVEWFQDNLGRSLEACATLNEDHLLRRSQGEACFIRDVLQKISKD